LLKVVLLCLITKFVQMNDKLILNHYTPFSGNYLLSSITFNSPSENITPFSFSKPGKNKLDVWQVRLFYLSFLNSMIFNHLFNDVNIYL